jgi:hypothetical protein
MTVCLLEVQKYGKCMVGSISQTFMQLAAEIKLIPCAQHLFHFCWNLKKNLFIKLCNGKNSEKICLTLNVSGQLTCQRQTAVLGTAEQELGWLSATLSNCEQLWATVGSQRDLEVGLYSTFHTCKKTSLWKLAFFINGVYFLEN